MPRFYETTLSITNLHNLSISTHVNRSRIDTSLSDYTPIYIKSSIVNSINNRMNTYNWQITWDSGAYPMP